MRFFFIVSFIGILLAVLPADVCAQQIEATEQTELARSLQALSDALDILAASPDVSRFDAEQRETLALLVKRLEQRVFNARASRPDLAADASTSAGGRADGDEAALITRLFPEHAVRIEHIRRRLGQLGEDSVAVALFGDLWAPLAKIFPLREGSRGVGATGEDDADEGERRERDPFSPSERMVEFGAGRGSSLRPETDQDPLGLAGVSFKLQGYVEDQRGTRLALLAAEGVGSILVREKERLHLRFGNATVELEILSIGRQGVAVKFGRPPIVQVVR